MNNPRRSRRVPRRRHAAPGPGHVPGGLVRLHRRRRRRLLERAAARYNRRTSLSQRCTSSSAVSQRCIMRGMSLHVAMPSQVRVHALLGDEADRARDATEAHWRDARPARVKPARSWPRAPRLPTRRLAPRISLQPQRDANTFLMWVAAGSARASRSARWRWSTRSP